MAGDCDIALMVIGCQLGSVVSALTLRLRDLLMPVLVWVIKAARLFAVV